jgi:hypothetical protein
MAEELRVVGVAGGWALPVRALVRTGLRPRLVLLRELVLARAAGRARVAEVGGVEAGLATGAADIAVLVAAVVGAAAAGVTADAVGVAVAVAGLTDAGAVVAAAAELVGVGSVCPLAPAELLEGVAAMREVLVRRGVRLAMGEKERWLGAGRAQARRSMQLASRPAPRNR